MTQPAWSGSSALAASAPSKVVAELLRAADSRVVQTEPAQLTLTAQRFVAEEIEEEIESIDADLDEANALILQELRDLRGRLGSLEAAVLSRAPSARSDLVP